MARLWVRWQFGRSWLQQYIYRPLPQSPQHKPHKVQHRFIPFSERGSKPKRAPLRIHFVAPYRASGYAETSPEHVQHALGDVELTLAQAITQSPALLALHIQPHTIDFQFAQSPQLSVVEQRNVVQQLQVQGYRAKWSEVTRLTLWQTSFTLDRYLINSATRATRWMPVLQDCRAVVWWPLAHNQHVMLVGALNAPLAAFVRQLQQLPDAERPEILVHDPDAYLQTLDDTFAGLLHDVKALAKARHFQLAHRFAVTREDVDARRQTPMCIVVAPDETIWPDLQPLLALNSAVQVILVLSNRPPIAALRAASHNLWIIEASDLRHGALPNAFRPSSVPAARHGQALAWSPNGRSIWRGLSLDEQTNTRRVLSFKERFS